MKIIKENPFYQKSENTLYPIAFYGGIATSRAQVLDFLVKSKEDDKPLHILLYGNNRSVKKHFSHTLGSMLEMNVNYIKNPDVGACTIEYITDKIHLAKKYLNPKKDIIIIEEVDSFVETPAFKKYLESKNQFVILWLWTYENEKLDRSLSSQFDYAMHLNPLTSSQRFELLSSAINKVQLSRYFPVSKIYKLAEDESHTIDSIETFVQETDDQ